MDAETKYQKGEPIIQRRSKMNKDWKDRSKTIGIGVPVLDKVE